MNLLRAASQVSGLTMVSRILGFVRDILIASVLGAGMVADAFFVAFKLPNFFRRLFAEGAFSAGFIPLFAEHLEEGPDGKADAIQFAENALASLLLVLIVFVALLQAVMPLAMLGLAPGFADNPVKFDLAVTLTRLTFPYLLFISIVSLMGGVLNGLGRFGAVAAAPILLNLTLIGALTFFAGYGETPGHALAVGVSVAGMLQLVWLLLALHREGIALRLPWPRLTPDIKRLLKLMAPVALGAGVAQINLVIDLILASLLPQGSVSYLYFADRLTQLPVGVIGVAVGTVLLPLLSRQTASGDTAGSLESQSRAIELVLFLTLPAAVAFAAMPDLLIGTLFEWGEFGAGETRQTGYALMAFALGIPAFVLIKVVTPGFFARQDTVTPMRIAIVALSVNVVLNLILMGPLKHAGLALASSLSGWLNVLALGFILWRRGHLSMDRALVTRIAKLLSSAGIMGVFLWLLSPLAADILPISLGDRLDRILWTAIMVASGALVYLGLAVASGAVRISDLRGMWQNG